jgi:hypothetical protein
MNFEPTEDVSDPSKQRDEIFLSHTYIFSSLNSPNVKISDSREYQKIQTDKRMPMPTNIAVAGENTWGADIIRAEVTKRYSGIHKANTLIKGG